MASEAIVVALTPAGFAACKQRLTNMGVAVPEGDRGSLSHEDVSVECDYNGTDTLTVSVVHKPCWISEGYVDGKIRAWFEEV